MIWRLSKRRRAPELPSEKAPEEAKPKLELVPETKPQKPEVEKPTALKEGLSKTRGGFIHVPYTPDQVAGRDGVPAMALATQVEGIRQALRSAVLTREDLRETGGREH